MDKTTKKTYDGLCSDFVFIETQDFEDGTPTTLPHRQMFYNTESGRAMLAEAAPELLDEILAVWGDQPAAMDGAEILEPFPTVEESVESLKAQMTDAQMALVEAYEAAVSYTHLQRGGCAADAGGGIAGRAGPAGRDGVPL